MEPSVAASLAEIHSEFGIFDIHRLTAGKSDNIIEQISDVSDLTYLRQFYGEYFKALTEKAGQRRGKVALCRTNVSRSVDLPFVGKSVLRTRHAKWFFVFEGALTESNRLSVTVLACLWPLEHEMAKSPHRIVREFWPSRYDLIVRDLGIKPEIADHSYVVDAVRIGMHGGKKPDREKNRELLRREIELLKPRLVVLVGKKAKNTIGNKAIRDNSIRCCYPVPFPTLAQSKARADDAKSLYEELKLKYAQLDD